MVDRGRSGGALWTHGGADRWHDSALTGAWLPAAPVRQSSPAGAQNGGESEGNSARVSPEFGRHCGGWAMVVRNGEVVALGERAAQVGREGNRSRERCGEARGGCSPFIGAEGAPGRGGWGG
jgi:hypothetical protein